MTICMLQLLEEGFSCHIDFIHSKHVRSEMKIFLLLLLTQYDFSSTFFLLILRSALETQKFLFSKVLLQLLRE